LLRHAHAANPGIGGGDHRRPLTGLGVGEATYIGRHMKDKGWQPEQILVSDALRTVQTAETVLEQLGTRIKSKKSNKLYLATPGDLIGHIHETRPEVQSLMIIAHNPGIHSLAMQLSDDGKTPDHRHLWRDFAPCTLAVIDFKKLEWNEIRARTGILRACITPPRDLED
jgi:phosphohistidine phosphatase